MSCNLSSNGLTDIEANEILADNINIYSNLNVSELSTFNNVSISSTLTVNGENVINKINDALTAPTINVNASTLRVHCKHYGLGDNLDCMDKDQLFNLLLQKLR